MKEVLVCLIFLAISSGILIGAYISERFDIWIVSAIAVMALWGIYDLDWRAKG